MSGQWWAVRAEALEGLSSAARVWLHTIRWLPLVGVALITALVFRGTGSSDIPGYGPGTIADRTVVAPVAVDFWERLERREAPGGECFSSGLCRRCW